MLKKNLKIFAIVFLLAIQLITSNAFAEKVTPQITTSTTNLVELNQVVPFATRYVPDYMVSYLLITHPTLDDIPTRVWYEDNGYGGYLDLYQVTKHSHTWEVHYRGYIYTID